MDIADFRFAEGKGCGYVRLYVCDKDRPSVCVED